MLPKLRHHRGDIQHRRGLDRLDRRQRFDRRHGATPTGTPYELMNILSFPGPGSPAEPEVAATIKARLDAINAAGGVHGHPVKLIQCLDHGDPNQSRTCANQAVSNPNVLGTVFVFSNNDNVIDPIMEAAGMPQIGIDPQGSDDPKCNVCFAFDGGGLSDTAGIGTVLHVYEGVNKIDMEIPQVPVAQAEMTVAKNNFLSVNPTGSVKEQFVPLTVANYAPYVEATRGYDGTALFTAGPQLAALGQAGVVARDQDEVGDTGDAASPPTTSVRWATC